MKKIICILGLFLVIIACKPINNDDNNGDRETNPDQYLISYEKLTSVAISPALLKQLIASFNIQFPDAIFNALKYSVNVYKVIYKTTYHGAETKASGACVVPQADSGESFKVLSYQHGTIFLNSDAPSEFKSLLQMGEEIGLNLLFGSSGFVCSIPDYLGYGISRDLIHPYLHAESTVSASLDMLRAVRELARRLEITLKNRYFLTGYSEGGYATLGLLREIQTRHASQFNLAATSAGSGAYDVLGTANHLVKDSTIAAPSFCSFIFLAYNSVYNWGRDLGEIFKSPYRERIEGDLFSGKYSRKQIDDQLTNVVADLFTEQFLEDFRGSGEEQVKNAFRENSLYSGWKPDSPLRLYHGTDDQIVPITNTETAYNNFINDGATQVTFVQLPGLGHGSVIFPWVIASFTWFLSF